MSRAMLKLVWIIYSASGQVQVVVGPVRNTVMLKTCTSINMVAMPFYLRWDPPPLLMRRRNMRGILKGRTHLHVRVTVRQLYSDITGKSSNSVTRPPMVDGLE